MSNIDSFQPGRDQDAWATLRGFKYQVDMSILRWLDLKPNDHLELERGEDIDHVAQALLNESVDNISRRLEQVRARDKRITLRSATALEVLANAVCHLNANAGLNLRFCYTTNAAVARERPNPFRGNMAGIELWEQLRKGHFTGVQRSDAAASLRQFLSLVAKPTKVADNVWAEFLDFINTDKSAFLELVHKFEWSCGALNPEDLTDEVRSRLRISIADIDDQRAEELHGRLFVFVFKILTQRGIKRLSQQELQEQLRAPTLSESDHAILKRLGERFGSLEQRVEEVESTIAEMSVEVRTLARRHRIHGSIGASGHVNLTSPPVVDHLAFRTPTVAELLRLLGDKRWLALYGLTDTGKSHLAALVSRRLESGVVWIRFGHSISSFHAQTILDRSLKSMGDIVSSTVIVLDDLPNISGDERFLESLHSLCDTYRDSGVRLISTSRFRLPGRLSTALGTERLIEIQSPMFSDAEAREVLVAHGAPEPFLLDSRVRFVNRLASGHPLLITLAARFLRDRRWQLRDEEFSALIHGEHTVDMIDEVIVRICQSLDVSQRELLYRLTLAFGAISEDVALRLAAVPRPIERPKECLTGLIGAWVQRESEHQLSVSPLARPIGSANLEPATAKACHRVLAENIVQQAMSPWDAEMAIRHFTVAAEFDKAGTLLLLLLSRLNSWQPHQELNSVLGNWSELPLPSQMDLGLRIRIRALQFWVFPKFHKSDLFVRQDLDELMQKVTAEHARDAQIVGLLAALFLSPRDFSRAIRCICKAIITLRGVNTGPADLILPKGKQFVEQLWVLIPYIQNATHLFEWVEAFELLTTDERTVVINSKDATLGSVVLADRLILVEKERPTRDQNWTSALSMIRRLREWAIKINWAHLESCAFKAEINVHGEFLKDIDTCEPDVCAFTNDASKSVVAKSLVAAMYGKMLTGAGAHQRALPWLKFAIDSPVIGLSHDRMMTLLAATQSCSFTDDVRGITYAEQAAQLARTLPEIFNLEAAKAFGELAIAILGRSASRETAIRAFPAWTEAAERLFRSVNRDDEWKDIFVLFAHIQGFVTLLAGTGQTPTSTRDGDEYAPPTQGMFFRSHPDRLSYFRESAVADIMWALSEYARYADDQACADLWLTRALETVADKPITPSTARIRQERIPEMFLANHFEDAVDAALRGSEAMVVGSKLRSKPREDIGRDEPLESLTGELPSEDRKLIDRFALIMGVVPALFRIGFVAMTNQDDAAEHASRVASVCRQVASAAVDSANWHGAAQIFDRLSAMSNGRETFDLANSFDQNEYRELRVLGYMASSLLAEPENAIRVQLASMAPIFSWYPIDSGVHLKLLVPFMESFWVTRFREARFRFRSPSLVEMALAELHAMDPKARVRATLRAVRPAFRLAGLSEADEWLNQEK